MTDTVLAVAMSEARIAAVICPALTKVVVRGLPFHFTAGEGPVIEKPLRTAEDVKALRSDRAAELEDSQAGDPRRDPLIDCQVAPVPVVLLRQVGQRALPGKRQRRHPGGLV